MIVRRRAFGPFVPIQERDTCRRAPLALGADVPVPEGPDEGAVAELDDIGAPVGSDVPLMPEPGALAIDVDDPPAVAVVIAGDVDATDPVVGGVGVGRGLGRVVDGAGGGFGRVVDGGGGGFGTVTVEVNWGRVVVGTVTVVTPGIGTETAAACPARRPQAVTPTRTAAVLICAITPFGRKWLRPRTGREQ